ncbi:kinase-like domain-containing protein [Leptodontidium sp. MPI-SDFR-AT-0119]|nr:kinase-like domain-containing protein [Leptodontidium sp. MPI-SDFR-AT-0119]
MLLISRPSSMASKLLKTIRRRERYSQSGAPRSLSITCRGKPIVQEDLFRYTNGRFLAAEDTQCRRRYLKFNVQKLCDVAAALGHPSPVIQIDKMEGGFSKALLLRRADGQEYLAKLPCPNAGPSHLTTASEVAVLQLVRSQTTVPVPRVLAWNSNPSNPVEAEYIVMEKAPGIQLFQTWDDLDGDSRLSLIKQLTELEHQLASIPFPASGHLYFMESILKNKHILLDSSVDPTSQYGIGPSWESVAAYGRALAEREIFRLRTQLSARPDRLHYANIEDDIALLQKAADLIDRLESHLSLEQNSRPTLWHTDLHMGNIFVSETEPSKIVSLIDWQSISVSPLFLQARWPIFLEPPDDYVKGFVHPQLPSDFETMDEEDKGLATSKFKQASRTKAYETSTYLKNRDAYNAMNVPRVFRELFIRCGEVFEEGVEPLRACLIEISQSWEQLKLLGTCPFSFTPNEISAHDIAFEEYEEFHRVRKFALEYLDTDSEGWIAPAMDFDEKQAQNKALFEYYLENLADGKSRKELLRI